MVTLFLPADVKARLAKLASRQHLTTRELILSAIQEKVENEEAAQAFRAEAEVRLAKMKRTGKGIPANEVWSYLERKVRGRPARRPRAV